MHSLRDAEFRVLRETIAWRGTVRMALVPIVLIGWAGIWSSLAFWRGLTVAAFAALALYIALPLVSPPPVGGGAR